MGRIVAEPQCPKVLVTGTHSTGKTTLVSELATRLGLPDTAVLPESARDCPFALNLTQNGLSTAWLLAAQMKAEIEHQTRPGTRLVICDRGLSDILAYHEVATAGLSRWMEVLAAEWLSTYDLVLLARPDPSQVIAPDVLRLDDATFRADVQRAIETRLAEATVACEPLPHGLAERLDRVTTLVRERGLLT